MSQERLLWASHLTKHFGSFAAVDDVSFEIQRGQIFGLLGPNGSGKSTIIRMLCGLLAPTSGEIQLDGIDVIAQPEEVKRRIGYMSQRFSLYRDLTVWENLTFFGGIYGLSGSALKARRNEVMELVGIGQFRDRLAGHLSGGWQQRLALACSMLHQPHMLFLDEPTAGIDPVARRHLWDLLFDLSSQGTTFLVTTHYMDEAERCSVVSYLFMSKLIVCGRPEKLKSLADVTPEGAEWLQIDCDQPNDGYRVLHSWEKGIRSATVFGQALHVLADTDLDHAALAKALEQASVTGVDIRRVQPSLEDVFVTLTERHLQLNAGSGANASESQRSSA